MVEFPTGAGARLSLRAEVRSACPVHFPEPCGCGVPPRTIERVYSTPDDIWTDNLAVLLNAGFLAQQGTLVDTAGANVIASVGVVGSNPILVGGTGTVAPQVTDHALGAIVAGSSGTVGLSVGQPISYGAIGTVPMGGTIANGSGVTQTYGEVGIETTVYGSHQILVARDVFATALPVSNGGQLALDYHSSNG